jgi:RNA polymerase sigma-70 factor, ECF subfamily
MSAHQQSDEWLMDCVCQGDASKMEILVRRYSTPIMTFLRRMVFDAHRSEELFQETFLAVWKHRSRYLRTLPFRPWLYQIALNKCRESIRHDVGRPITFEKLSLEPVAVGELKPPEAAVAAELQTIVIEAVERLPAQQRAVLVMRIWNELPFDEIAVALGCTSSTARSHMHHGLNVVRKYLEPRMREE